MHCLLTEIAWDLEGQPLEDCNLPTTILVLDVPPLPMSSEIYQEVLGEVITEAFGFRHYGFKLDGFSSTHDTHAGGGFFPSHLGIVAYKTPASEVRDFNDVMDGK